jgi:pre-mRNA-processing factor 40
MRQGSEDVWKEHTAPDGRTYYFNSETKQSVWEKPAALKTQGAISSVFVVLTLTAELLLLSCPWKEATAEDGSKYYYHSRSKLTSWNKPKVL